MAAYQIFIVVQLVLVITIAVIAVRLNRTHQALLRHLNTKEHPSGHQSKDDGKGKNPGRHLPGLSTIRDLLGI